MKAVDKAKFAVTIALTSFFLTVAAVNSVAQRPVMVFISSALMWSGYLLAHKISEGTFVDGHEEDDNSHMIPHDRERWAGVIIGSLILISGFAVAIQGLREESLVMTFPAATFFWTGYIVAHYNATDELL
jgi:hypothetical protein